MMKTSAEAVFLTLALFFGGVFVVLIPPFQSPDEPNHLLRAYQLSEGVFSPERQDQRLGGVLPASLPAVRDSFTYLKMNYAARLDKSLIFRCLTIPLRPGERIFSDFPNTAIYAPTAYLPQAAAIALLRPAGATALQLLYAARFANLFVWTLLVLASIRLMPFLKGVVTTLALFPASLVIAASANADVITNGLCWWLTAAALHSFREEAQGAALFFPKKILAFAVVCANKLIALPLVLTHCFRFVGPYPGGPTKRKQFFWFSFLAAAGLAAALTWGYFAREWFIPYDAYHPAFRDAQTLNEGVDPARQQAFMLENPFFFVKIAAKSFIGALPSIAAHLTGKFGWEKNYLPPVWIALMWLALAALMASEENPLSGRQRWLAVAAVVLYSVMFAATMYALWCPVRAGGISNFQGRYFVPVLPVAALGLAGGCLRLWRQKICWVVVIALIMSNLAMVSAILERYYR